MKRTVWTSCVLIWVVLLFSACSGSGGGTGSSDTTTQNQDVEDPESPDVPENPEEPDIAEPGTWNPDDFDHVIDVGPGLDYETPTAVPWASIGGSTLVRIHWRSEPYRSKWVITTAATESDPLVILGVSDNGEKPVITGDGAVTPPGLYYLNEARSVVKVGNYTGEDDSGIPAHVILENLDIRSGRPGYSYTNRNGGSGTYNTNAAAVHIEEGESITVRNCALHDSGNGLFSGHFSRNVRVSNNHIYDNGIEGSGYEHNTYTESFGIVYQFNHFGPLRNGCNGNNLKDRSAGTVIRYNWIEAGNRQLDLVESDYRSFADDPSYDSTFVYGNILVEPDGAGNSQIIHYGGDGGDQTLYRHGTLYFYNNTVVSTRSGNTTLIRLSTTDVTADMRNNIIHTTASPGHLSLTNGLGRLYLYANYFTQGYVNSFESTSATVLANSDNITGTSPGFTDIGTQDFTLVSGSLCENAGTALAGAAADYPLSMSYVVHGGIIERIMNGIAWDLGAFER